MWQLFFTYMHHHQKLSMVKHIVWQLFYVLTDMLMLNDLVLPSRTAVLWISHNVECGHKIKRINNLPGWEASSRSSTWVKGARKNEIYVATFNGYLFYKLFLEVGRGKNSGCDDWSPSHTTSQRKCFAFLDFQQVSIILWFWQSYSCHSIEWDSSIVD